MKASVCCTRRQYVCANERLKLTGTIDGFFPDTGHHLENEMGGLWLYPIKLLDGFWMRFTDHTSTADCWIHADEFCNYPHKNEFIYGNGLGHTTVTIRRTQVIPDDVLGLTVTYEFHNHGSRQSQCSARFLARTDLRPVWMSEDAGIFDGETDEIVYISPSFQNDQPVFIAKDCSHPWYVAVGSSQPADKVCQGQMFGPENTEGRGVSMEMTYNFTLEPDETYVLKFYISGSDISQKEALDHYGKLTEDTDYEQQKASRYDLLMEKTALKTGNARFDEIFNWVKVHTDWLITATSNGNRGIAAGYPEYPWWFGCDSFYTLQGVLCLGDYKLCKDTLKLILDYSVKYNGNGRIVHEILTNEVCPNYGNTQETAHFIMMMWDYYEWTGDSSLLEEAFDYMGKSVQWLSEQDDDGDLFPTGYGIIEIAGLNMELIDTAVYTCQAYECYGKICRLFAQRMPRQGEGIPDGIQDSMSRQELEDKAAYYEDLAQRTKDAVNTPLWNEEEGLYCDAYTSYAALQAKKDMLLNMERSAKSDHIREYVQKLFEERKNDGSQEKGWLLNRNWVINVPMECGLAPKDKADIALKNMHTPEFIGPYGMYLEGIAQGAAMTISTGAMAVAQARYGYSDRALELIEKIFSTFGMATPGSISEMSPDYGCFVQAWTTYGVMLPVTGFFFGIQPKASQDKIVLNPCLPESWTDASLEHVRVFDGEISMTCKKTASGTKIQVINTTGKPVEICHEGMFLLDDTACRNTTSSDKARFTMVLPE